MGYSFTAPDKNWAREPIERTEVLWIVIAASWCLFMFVWMIAWHWIGDQNMRTEAYRTFPDVYAKKTEEFTKQYTVRQDASDPSLPVVAPPPGSDVYIAASTFQFRPVLELQKGKSYRLHISSLDYVHGFSLQPENINFQSYPGYEQVITVTPNKAGTYGIVCNEYCGLGHHIMLGRIYVKE
jgi:cytochrome c oxidase subunit 2